VADRIRPRARSVRTQVLERTHAARAILETASENSVDLVAMETHGRSGLSPLLMGSVADKVARSACVPVLLHRTREEER
jgi:nucleotide-binding universal stress UspA family protein